MENIKLMKVSEGAANSFRLATNSNKNINDGTIIRKLTRNWLLGEIVEDKTWNGEVRKYGYLLMYANNGEIFKIYSSSRYKNEYEPSIIDENKKKELNQYLGLVENLKIKRREATNRVLHHLLTLEQNDEFGYHEDNREQVFNLILLLTKIKMFVRPHAHYSHHDCIKLMLKDPEFVIFLEEQELIKDLELIIQE